MGVSVETENVESVAVAVRRFGVPYRQFLADETVMQAYFASGDPAALPSTYVFDAADRLRRVFRGAVNEADLDSVLLSLHEEGTFEADVRLLARRSFRLQQFEQ